MFGYSLAMLTGLLTPSQYVAIYILCAYAAGIAIAADPARAPRLARLDLRPLLAVQVTQLLCMGATVVIWPDYPREGAGEYARTAAWVPAVIVGLVEVRRATRGRASLVARRLAGPAARLGVLTVYAWVAWHALQRADILTLAAASGAATLCLPWPAHWERLRVPVPRPRLAMALAAVAVAMARVAWALSPSARAELPASATNIEESYINFVFPPDYSYELSADVPEADAGATAARLGLTLPAPGGESRLEEDGCESDLDWKPPRLTFSDGCS